MHSLNALSLAYEFDGGGKVKDDAKRVKVVGDASITFPLLVAGAFKLGVNISKENKSL